MTGKLLRLTEGRKNAQSSRSRKIGVLGARPSPERSEGVSKDSDNANSDHAASGDFSPANHAGTDVSLQPMLSSGLNADC